MIKKYDSFWANFESYNLSSEFKHLINHLICFEPKERLMIEQIMEHPWIKMNVKYNYLNKNELYIDEDVVSEFKKRQEFMKKKAN